MKPAKIFFDIEDDEYFSRLREYIILNYQTYFRISDEKDSSDYVITDYLNKRNSRSIIVIKENGGDIGKYLKATDICSGLISIIYEGEMKKHFPEAASAKILCVTSAAGGAGKTLVAKTLGKHCSNLGFRTLYINMDPASAGETETDGEKSNNLDRLIYCLLYNKDGFLLESIAETEKCSGLKCICNMIPSPENPPNKRVSGMLMERLSVDTFYEYIILDWPSHLSEGLQAVLNGADMNIAVSRGTGKERDRLFLDFLKDRAGERVVEVNNFSCNEEWSLPDFRSDGDIAFEKAVKDLWKRLGV